MQALQIPLLSRKRTYLPSIDRVTTAHMLDRDQTYANCFRNLLVFSSTVKAELAREGSNTAKIASLLEEARSSTKRSHANSVKKAIGDWHTFSPGPSKKPSSPWGWNHEECARMLCPPTIEWNETRVVFIVPHIPSSHVATEPSRTSVIQSNVRNSSLPQTTSHDSSGTEKHWMTPTQLLGFCVTQSCSP